MDAQQLFLKAFNQNKYKFIGTDQPRKDLKLKSRTSDGYDIIETSLPAGCQVFQALQATLKQLALTELVHGTPWSRLFLFAEDCPFFEAQIVVVVEEKEGLPAHRTTTSLVFHLVFQLCFMCLVCLCIWNSRYSSAAGVVLASYFVPDMLCSWLGLCIRGTC
jgi:hypothetical protein